MFDRAFVTAVLVATAVLALPSIASRSVYVADAGSTSPPTGLRPVHLPAQLTSFNSSSIAVWGRVGFTWYTFCFFTGYYLDADDGSRYWLQPDSLVGPYAGQFVLVTGTFNRDVEGCSSIEVRTITPATPPIQHLHLPVVTRHRDP